MKAVHNIPQVGTEATLTTLDRLLWTLFLCFSALCLSLPSANAQQVYVSGIGGTVGVCDASLAGAFSGNFIRLSVGANVPLALAGNTLYVGQGNMVVAYNATTGAALNEAFVVTPNFATISALAISGNTLYVAYNGFVGAYNATTGAAINITLILLPNPAVNLAVSGNTLFALGDGVRSYNAASGAVINANLITSATVPGISRIAVSGSTLFVSNGTIGTYSANTGTAINANFITGAPSGALAISGNTLFALGASNITSYDTGTGAQIGSIALSPFTANVGLAVGGASANPNVLNFGTLAVNWRIEAVGKFFTTGNIDLVFFNTNATATVPLGDSRAIWYLTDGVLSGTNKWFPESLPVVPVPGPPWRIAGAGDFNGDGSTDPVWENTSTGQRAIWLLQNIIFRNSLRLPTISPEWRIVGAGDFNKDGSADLVWENTATGQRSIWLLSNGVLSSTINLPSVGTQWHIAGVGDFAGDGNADLVWENTVTGQHAIWFLQNGIFSSSLSLPTLSTQWRIAGVGDFNGDGQADLVWQNTSTGQIVVWLLKDGVLPNQ
jgi:FG-GAP-like repeat/FG-GAP repeat